MGLVITLIVAGAVLLALETVLPGMVAGAIGLLCLIGAVCLAYVTQGPQVGSYVLFGVIAGLIAGTMVWLKIFPQTRFARMFTSQQTIGDIGAEKPELLHQVGEALTPLRPSGTAVFNGQRVDVVSEGGMIDRHTPVKVVAIEGMRVVVRALSNESETQHTTT